MIEIAYRVTRPLVPAVVTALLAACGGGTSSGADGSDGSTVYKGANYDTALGNAMSATGCGYAFSVSGNITLTVSSSGTYGDAAGTMSIGVVNTTPSSTSSCPQQPYTVTQSSNAVQGSFTNLTADAGDAFNNWAFAGARAGNTLVGSLSIDVTTPDLDGGGSYTTFPTVVISNYVLTKQ